MAPKSGPKGDQKVVQKMTPKMTKKWSQSILIIVGNSSHVVQSRGHHGNKSTREYGINLDEVNILHRDIDTIEVHGQVGSAEGHLAQYNS